MKRRTYRAIINNNGRIIKMIVGGKNKQSVKNKLTDFFVKTNQTTDISKLDIFLEEVELKNGRYIIVE